MKNEKIVYVKIQKCYNEVMVEVDSIPDWIKEDVIKNTGTALSKDYLFCGFGNTQKEAIDELIKQLHVFKLHGKIRLVKDNKDIQNKIADKLEGKKSQMNGDIENLGNGRYRKYSPIPGDTYSIELTSRSSWRDWCRSLCD